MDNRFILANNVINYLSSQSGVKNCFLHGSLATDSYDAYSDIDIVVDVSGQDNGLFMLALPALMAKKFDIAYTAFAPGLLPSAYVVSFALKEANLFSFIDIECVATPHAASVTKDEVLKHNDPASLFLKLSIGNTKQLLRGRSCREEILRIASFVLVKGVFEYESEKDILIKTLDHLEKTGSSTIAKYAFACKNYLL